MRFLLLSCIRFYQKTLSPDHGLLRRLYPLGFCRFTPTCSSYGHDAIKLHGVFRGIFLTFARIARCNPWSKGGHDPVPNLFHN